MKNRRFSLSGFVGILTTMVFVVGIFGTAFTGNKAFGIPVVVLAFFFALYVMFQIIFPDKDDPGDGLS